MERRRRTGLSKKLAFVLRHAPESVGLSLDKEGWADVAALLESLTRDGPEVSRTDLEEVVANDSKGRYQLSDGRIRAVQGHSTSQVDRSFEEREPPPTLFHGTTSGAVPAILSEGVRPMDRHYVHLSKDVETARTVALRHVGTGERPVVLSVDCAAMRRAGACFYRAENDVWLVAEVAPRFVRADEGR